MIFIQIIVGFLASVFGALAVIAFIVADQVRWDFKAYMHYSDSAWLSTAISLILFFILWVL